MGLTAKHLKHTKQIEALIEFQDEYLNARTKFKPMNSAHEGYAVLLEELDEMWEEIKNNDPKAMRKEALQVGAMILAFVLEVCDAD